MATLELVDNEEVFDFSAGPIVVEAPVKKVLSPRVQIIGEHETSKGLRIDMDWNDDFITYLRNGGYEGLSDEDVVQLWLQQLARNVAAGPEDGK